MNGELTGLTGEYLSSVNEQVSVGKMSARKCQREEGRELLEVSTGSRLHFGLLELAVGARLRFGGLGLMLDDPGWVLQFDSQVSSLQSSTTSTLHSSSPEIFARIAQVRERLRQLTSRPHDAQVNILHYLPLHSGLGAGTQLATAVAVGLILSERSVPEAIEPTFNPTLDDLVHWSGRGKRSGIGLFGYLHGGLILDEGHSAGESELSRSITATSSVLPAEWRVVLITPDCVPEVTGGYEASLIEQLGGSPNPKRERMLDLAKRLETLTRTAGDFYDFTESLQQYLDAAGELFAAGQGGMYNGESVTEAVGLAKRSGLRAVGQSSWGPTVFGFAADLSASQQIAKRLQELRPNERWQILICTPARQGASWRWVPD